MSAFTKIDRKDESTWPPIGKSVLMVTKGGIYKGFFNLESVERRRRIVLDFGYTHWRHHNPEWDQPQ